MLKHIALQDVENRGRAGNKLNTSSEPSCKTRSCCRHCPSPTGSLCIRSLLGDRKRKRRDSQALDAKLRAQVLHRVDTCQPIPCENPELSRQLLTSSLPLLSAASRRLKDSADELGGNSLAGQRGGAGLSPGLSLATSGQLRARGGGNPVWTKHRVCGLLEEAKNGVGRPMWGTNGVACGRTWRGFPCSFRSTFGHLIWIPVFLESQEGWLRCRNDWGRSQPLPEELKILDPNLDGWASSPASHTGSEWHWKDNFRWRTWVQKGLSLVYKANSRHGHDQVSSLVNKKCTFY